MSPGGARKLSKMLGPLQHKPEQRRRICVTGSQYSILPDLGPGGQPRPGLLTAHLTDELLLGDDVEEEVLRAALRTADTLVVATVLASLVTNSQHTLPSLDLLLEILTENYQISISCLKPRKSATPLFRLFNNILPS